MPLDPEFCVKGVRGMLGEMKANPGRFAGRRVLFLHSGMLPYIQGGEIMAICCLQVAPMDCLMGESMKLSETDQKLIKHLNLVMYFLAEIEINSGLFVLLVHSAIIDVACMPHPHPV